MTGAHIGRADTDVYKGVGILLIVLHNFFHWVRPSPGENEFTFNPERTARLLDGLARQPLESINLLLDYFGHYGVQLFVFLSAYGLARAGASRAVPWLRFMWQRLAKIYPVFLVAIAAHFLFVVTPWNPDAAWFAKVYLLKLSSLSAFVPDMSFALVGPWWFFAFIVQFYAVFPLLQAAASRYGTPALVGIGALGFVATLLFNPWLHDRGLNLYVTVVGHLPVLCLGLWFARADDVRVPAPVAALAAALFVAALWSHAAWWLAPLCVTLVLLYVMPHAARLLAAWPVGQRFVRYCGAVSLPLFAMHGMLRTPFTEAANDRGQWWFTLLAAVAFVAASLAVAQLVHWAVGGGRGLATRRGAVGR